MGYRMQFGRLCCATPRGRPAPESAGWPAPAKAGTGTCLWRSEEHTSELQSLMRISYAVFCLKKKKKKKVYNTPNKMKTPIRDNNHSTTNKCDTATHSAQH